MTWSLPSIFSGVFGDWLIVGHVSSESEDYCCCLRHQVWRVTWLKNTHFLPWIFFLFGKKHPPMKPLSPNFLQQTSSQDFLARIGSQASSCSPREAVVVSINFTSSLGLVHSCVWAICAICLIDIGVALTQTSLTSAFQSHPCMSLLQQTWISF